MKRAILLVLSVVLTCNLSSQNKVDINKPMYGEAEKSEKFKKADEEFRKTTLEKFGNVDSAVVDYVENAWSFFYHNNLEAAMRRFNQAWLLNPECPDAYFGFAALLEMQGNYTEATRFYLLGSEKDRNNKQTIACFYRIAECKEQLNDLQGAIGALLKISQFTPNEVFLFKKMGQLYLTLKNNTLALDAFTRAIELDPKDPMTFFNRAVLHQSLDAHGKAIVDYTNCIILDKTNVDAYVNRGIMELYMGNHAAGKQDFETGTQLNAKSGIIWRYLGIANLSLNDRPGACENFSTAKQLGDTEVDDLISKYCK